MINKQKAADFAEFWKGRGDEKSETSLFWISLIQDVLGISDSKTFIEFEKRVQLTHVSFIDAYIPSTKVLIEQKGADVDLHRGYAQSDGSMLTPFQQAKRYADEMPYDIRPRWIVVCNFQSFLIYDMNNPHGEPFEILLENIEKECHLLAFLTDTGSTDLRHELEVSIKAGEIIGKIYDGFLSQYSGAETADDLHALNVLCVRLVFCLYAEDAGIFGKDQFFNYLKNFKASQMRVALKELFHTLDTPEDKRDKFLEPELKAFPYVNGSLFKEEQGFDIPPISEQTAEILLKHASEEFDWSEISPTIFGAVFESTLNPDTRRSGGMHYTSIENIHKVIDPLFLNDLNTEFDEACQMPLGKKRTATLDEFQTKLSTLTFLDPAAGSGNFLTETYISLRRLENKVILEKTKGQMLMGFDVMNPVKVNIHQFYGIEINDFAVTVATTALWIAEAQMLKETEKIINLNLDYLPLKSNSNIVKGNALRLDWNDVVPKESLNYIMGNPPFVGKKEQTKSQKEELISLFPSNYKGVGNLDYVSGWYVKAAQFIKNTNTKSAFVSTNSITQGEQVPLLWKYLISEGLQINFAYKTFRWDSEASIKAHVHCVIIGFSSKSNDIKKYIYNGDIRQSVHHIHPYIIECEDIFVESRIKSICNVPEISYGSMPIDDGHLILEKEDVEQLLKENSLNKEFIRKYAGGVELLRNQERWCLWLKNISPKQINNSLIIKERVALTKEFRLSSNRPQTLKLAETPMLFGEIRQPNSEMLVIPKVSSESRRYIPIAFVTPDVIINGSALIIPNASLFLFGILMSNVHNAWMRTVGGRMKSDYQYSGNVVYNNFPWPEVTSGQKEKIEQTAQAILDARALYPECSLADLYDETTMPPELRKAHQANDRAVMEAYGFNLRMTESECVAELMKLYQQLTNC